jgi:hypothetical protein
MLGDPEGPLHTHHPTLVSVPGFLRFVLGTLLPVLYGTTAAVDQLSTVIRVDVCMKPLTSRMNQLFRACRLEGSMLATKP